MKLYDSNKIFAGVFLFVGIAAFPFYYNIGKENTGPELKLDTPVIQRMEKETGKKQCVEPGEFMRIRHMRLLNEWRDSVVRDADAVYHSSLEKPGDKPIIMSLQKTCMHCHSNKRKFCDECHNYLAIKPLCWDCHRAPKGDEES